MIASLTSLEAMFVFSGVLLMILGAFTFVDRANPRRFGTGLFWVLLGVAFAFGGVLPAWATGALVIAMVAIDGLGAMGQGRYGESSAAEREVRADQLGWRIFLPVLIIPALTYAASLVPWGTGVSGDRVVFVSLGYASVAAALVALAITRARPLALVHEGRRLADAIGAVVILPQLLASLGTLFTRAGVGTTIAGMVSAVAPEGNLFAVVLAASLSIAAFTAVMGNSFAAFPVIMAGVGVPLLITPFDADPALVAVTLLTCASCGTLCTPMAANFNIVPPALFEMHDRYGVIRFQAPFALAMFVVHVLLLWWLIRV